MKSSVCLVSFFSHFEFKNNNHIEAVEVKAKDLGSYILPLLSKLMSQGGFIYIYILKEKFEIKTKEALYYMEKYTESGILRKKFSREIDLISDLNSIFLGVDIRDLGFSLVNNELFLISYSLSSDIRESKDYIEIEFNELANFVLSKIHEITNNDHFIYIYSLKIKNRIEIGKIDFKYYIENVTANGVFYKEYSSDICLIHDLNAVASGADPETIGFDIDSM